MNAVQSGNAARAIHEDRLRVVCFEKRALTLHRARVSEPGDLQSIGRAQALTSTLYPRPDSRGGGGGGSRSGGAASCVSWRWRGGASSACRGGGEDAGARLNSMAIQCLWASIRAGHA